MRPRQQEIYNVHEHVSRVPVLFSLGNVPFRELLCCNSFSESIPKLQHHHNLHLLYTPSFWHTCLCVSVCVKQQAAAYCSHPGQQAWGFTVLQAWIYVERGVLVTPTSQTNIKKTELFIQRNIIYTIYTEELPCISSFTTFCINGNTACACVCIYILILEDRRKLIWPSACYFCFYSFLLVQPVCRHNTFSSLSHTFFLLFTICYVYHSLSLVLI